MAYPLLQTSLCFVLCPLLAAQQIAQAASPSSAPSQRPAPAPVYVTLPANTKIELLAPGPTSFAKARAGVAVQFVVDKDVVLAGAPMIHAGVPVAGIVDLVVRGSHRRHRDGEMEIRVNQMISREPIELHLRCFETADSSGRSYDDGEGFNLDKGAVIAGIALVIIGNIAFALHKDK